ncbi:hypothetical protein [Phyllobacterium meliloti]|uniref:hypothetical protein n=1 Tax=Phyllobacterium meliloti TaxID=555317 RepID=UPI001D13947A|nr:hypothetical protein [Phyllobacterium sp. T1293]UGX85353.1 hypothetical protein LLE53_012885 [Phyllobacterium sp. T1293]
MQRHTGSLPVCRNRVFVAALSSFWSLASNRLGRVWYLLMIISVVLVTWVHPPRGKDEPDDQANS